MRPLAVWTGLLIFVAGAWAQSTAPATQSAEVSSDAELREICRALAWHALASGQAADAEAAADLRRIHNALADALGAYEPKDPEAEARWREAFAVGAGRARFWRAVTKLAPPLDAQLIRLEADRPEMVRDVLGDDASDKVAALMALADLSQPEPDAAPLVYIGLVQGESEVRLAAALAAKTHVRSEPAIGKMLISRLRSIASGRRSHRFYPHGSNQVKPLTETQALIQAIEVACGRDAVEPLIAMVRTTDLYNAELCMSLADLFGACADARDVPALAGRLKPGGSYSRSVNGVQTTCGKADVYLLAICRILDEPPVRFGLMATTVRGHPMLGFPDDNARKAGQKTFKQFWKDEGPKRVAAATREHKAPLRPDAPASAPAPTSAPASAPAPPARPDTSQVAAAEAYVRRTALAAAADFGSERFLTRQDAADRFASLQDVILRPLAEADRASTDGTSAAPGLLEDMIIDLRFAAMRAELSAEDRQALDRLMRDAPNPQTVRDFLAIRDERRCKAMEWLAANDKNGDGAGFLPLALNDPSPRVLQAALDVVQTGRYRSQAVADLVKTRLLTLVGDCYDDYDVFYKSRDQIGNYVQALAVVAPEEASVLIFAMVRDERGMFRNVGMKHVGKIGSLGAIPLLLPMLDETSVYSSRSSGSMRITTAKSDAALMALVQLTKQKPADYGLQYWKSGFRVDTSTFGFPNEESRAKGIETFRAWWENARKTEPYKSIKPLEEVKLRDLAPKRNAIGIQ